MTGERKKLALLVQDVAAWLKRVPLLRRLFAAVLVRNRYRHFQFSDWVRRGLKLTQNLEYSRVTFEGDQVWIATDDGVEFAFVKELAGEGLAADVYRGTYEPGVTKQLLGILADKRVFFDVGANVGWFSVMAAKRNPDLYVHSFEPGGLAVHYLRTNVEKNGLKGRIRINKTAVYENTGPVRFTESTIGHALNYVSVSAGSIRKRSQTSAITLDDYVTQAGLQHVDCIKCDAEGAELSVLKGGVETLRRFRPVLFLEVAELWLSRYGHTPAQIREMLEQLGYDYGVITSPGELVCSGDFETDLGISTNVLFHVTKATPGSR